MQDDDERPEGPWKKILLSGGAILTAAAAYNAFARKGVDQLSNLIGGEEGGFEWRDRRVAFTKHGEGPPILLVHGIHAAALVVRVAKQRRRARANQHRLHPRPAWLWSVGSPRDPLFRATLHLADLGFRQQGDRCAVRAGRFFAFRGVRDRPRRARSPSVPGRRTHRALGTRPAE